MRYIDLQHMKGVGIGIASKSTQVRTSFISSYYYKPNYPHTLGNLICDEMDLSKIGVKKSCMVVGGKNIFPRFYDIKLIKAFYKDAYGEDCERLVGISYTDKVGDPMTTYLSPFEDGEYIYHIGGGRSVLTEMQIREQILRELELGRKENQTLLSTDECINLLNNIDIKI